jgi:hypothetical protein
VLSPGFAWYFYQEIDMETHDEQEEIPIDELADDAFLGHISQLAIQDLIDCLFKSVIT